MVINHRTLSAMVLMSQAADKKDKRPLVRHIHFDFRQPWGLIAAASGPSMLVASVALDLDLAGAYFTLTTAEAAEFPKNCGITASCTPDGVRVEGGGRQFSAQILSSNDPCYVDWHRICPAEFSGVGAQFDPRHIAVFAKIAKTLGFTPLTMRIGHNGDSAALVELAHGCPVVGLLEPLVFRTLPPVSKPTWL